jgi:hypothetical protein
MDVSLWLVAALILIPAVQVPLVLYLARYVAVEDSELPSLPSGYASPPAEWGLDDRESRDDPDDQRPADSTTAVCRCCGTANERGYRFCRECASLL